MTPEQIARQQIDESLEQCGWEIQSLRAINLHASLGVAVREFPLVLGHGKADYLLFVNGKAAGAVEAKEQGFPLRGVEPQSAKYSAGLPPAIPAWRRPLPFL